MERPAQPNLGLNVKSGQLRNHICMNLGNLVTTTTAEILTIPLESGVTLCLVRKGGHIVMFLNAQVSFYKYKGDFNEK